jgi:mannose-1-phosphate guanylyltransferase/mannose-1-phosphate guanylyltransferase/mannose-6-phosphate isomerase
MLRLKDLPNCQPPLAICNEEHRFMMAEQLREIGIKPAAIILEPIGRNTAPAVALAALAATSLDDILLVLPADHVIANVAAFLQAVQQAEALAQQDYLVTFGIVPTHPETGYGYIETGDALPGSEGVKRIARFVEKPDAARAAEFLKTGRHLWNSGMFVATAATMLAELEAHAPEVLQGVRAAVAGAARDGDFIRLEAAAFTATPAISIDYAVMERTQKAAVVPAAIGWSDIGSWAALWDIQPKDAAGNATLGPVELVDAKNCYVRSETILTGVIGLENAVVVVTDDAVLALHRDRAQDVKKLVDRLKARGAKEATEHRRAYRPWGHYEGLIMGERFQVKKIEVRPGAKLSLQKHFHRAEHWVVVSGTAIVRRDGEEIMLRENESVYLPLGCIHRMENPGKIPLTLIEVQSGSYLGEDDIVRFEDTYGRS